MKIPGAAMAEPFFTDGCPQPAKAGLSTAPGRRCNYRSVVFPISTFVLHVVSVHCLNSTNIYLNCMMS